MSNIVRLNPCLTSLPTMTQHGSSRIPQQFSIPGLLVSKFPGKSLNFPQKIGVNGRNIWALTAWTQEGPLPGLDDSPVSVQLVPISSESQFDRVLGEAHQLGESVVIVWMANWCRKCIYLKPKLEKLAAEYYQRLRFYCVDVNTVSHKLVARAAVTKMPTMQLWKDNKKQDEVFGGHKAHLVINEWAFSQLSKKVLGSWRGPSNGKEKRKAWCFVSLCLFLGLFRGREVALCLEKGN